MWRRWCGGRWPSGPGTCCASCRGSARSRGSRGCWARRPVWTCSRCTGGHRRPCRTPCWRRGPAAGGAGDLGGRVVPHGARGAGGGRLGAGAGAAGGSRARAERADDGTGVAGGGAAAGGPGRAGGPGTVYRCWAEAEDVRLPRFPAPEIKVADLTAFALQAACWGIRRPPVWPCWTRRPAGRWRRRARCCPRSAPWTPPAGRPRGGCGWPGWVSTPAGAGPAGRR